MPQELSKSVRIVGRSESDAHPEIEAASPAERLGMMWQLALDAWAFKEGGGQHGEAQLQRHVVRLRRRGG